MRKAIVTIITAVFLGVLAVNTTLMPIAIVYAAEQDSGDREVPTDKKNDGHSGHH